LGKSAAEFCCADFSHSVKTDEARNALTRAVFFNWLGEARDHFFDQQRHRTCGLNLVTRSLDPAGRGRTRWTMRWKPALNAFAITFQDRRPAAETY